MIPPFFIILASIVVFASPLAGSMASQSIAENKQDKSLYHLDVPAGISKALRNQCLDVLHSINTAPEISMSLRHEAFDLIHYLRQHNAGNEATIIEQQLAKRAIKRRFLGKEMTEKASKQPMLSLSVMQPSEDVAQQPEQPETSYKLILPNEQALSFGRSLIQHSELLKEFFADITNTDYYITNHISDLETPSSPHEVSLQMLRTILKTIAQQPHNPEALQQVIFGKVRHDKLSGAPIRAWQRDVELFKVANYFGIKPLQTMMAERLATRFAFRSSQYTAALESLPLATQKQITPMIFEQDAILSPYLRHNYLLQDSVPSTYRFTTFAWSPDSTKVAVLAHEASAPKRLSIITQDVVTGKADHVMLPLLPPAEFLPCGIIWVDSSLAVVAQGKLHMVDLAPIDCYNPIPSVVVTSIAASPTEPRMLAVGCAYGSVLRVMRGEPAKKIWDGANMITHLTWSPDGQELAFCDQSALVILNTKTETVRKVNPRFLFDAMPIGSIKWSPDGTKIAYTTADRITILSPATMQPSCSWKNNTPSRSIAWSLDSEQLATIMPDGKIQWHDVTTGEEAETLTAHMQAHFSEIATAPDGNWLAGLISSLPRTKGNNAVCFWNRDPRMKQLSIVQLRVLKNCITEQTSVVKLTDSFAYATLPSAWKQLVRTTYSEEKKKEAAASLE